MKIFKKEPFITIDNNYLNHKLRLSLNNNFRQNEKYLFYKRAYDFLYEHNIDGSYFEFGVHKARTFRMALRESYIKEFTKEFYAFDSFEGLPYEKNFMSQNFRFKKNNLITSVNQFKKDINPYLKGRKVNIIKGFYEKTLNGSLIKKLRSKNIKASFICIDCDLNKSVELAIKFCKPFFMQGTVLYVDDYYSTFKGDPRKGNVNIINNFFKKNNILAEPYYNVASCGKSFLIYQ